MKPSNAETLRLLMRRHGLTRAAVAETLGVSHATVDAWLRPPRNRAHRAMPDPMIELLRLKLAASRPPRAAK